MTFTVYKNENSQGKKYEVIHDKLLLSIKENEMVGSTSLVLIISIKELGRIHTRGQKRLFERKSTMENLSQLMNSFLCPRTWITTQFNWVSTINGAFDDIDMHGQWDDSEASEHPRRKKRPVTGGSLGGAESNPFRSFILRY